jgi:hypothetical protein
MALNLRDEYVSTCQDKVYEKYVINPNFRGGF